MTLKPNILMHPHIPVPLHYVNPRTIMGQVKWDRLRYNIYKLQEYRCRACGVHKSEAKGHKWLELHEYWNIDYQTGECMVTGMFALCHYCHSFIHSGRLYLIMNEMKSKREVKAILEHGFRILADNNLKCFPFTLKLAKLVKANTYECEAYTINYNPKLKSEDYVLYYGSKEYRGVSNA